jgi:putative serine protease PepD
MTGKVVGVNAQIESDSGDNAGVGFAIPSNTVKTVVAQILSSGTVEHAYLGVSIGDAALAGRHGPRPCRPGDARRQGRASGRRRRDGRQRAVGRQRGSPHATVSGHRPGDKVTVTYTRNGSSHAVTVTLGTRPSSS